MREYGFEASVIITRSGYWHLCGIDGKYPCKIFQYPVSDAMLKRHSMEICPTRAQQEVSSSLPQPPWPESPAWTWQSWSLRGTPITLALAVTLSWRPLRSSCINSQGNAEDGLSRSTLPSQNGRGRKQGFPCSCSTTSCRMSTLRNFCHILNMNTAIPLAVLARFEVWQTQRAGTAHFRPTAGQW